MNEGPFRAPRPGERRVTSEPEPPRRQAEEPQPIQEPESVDEPRFESSRTAPEPPKKKFPKKRLIIIIAAIIVVLAAAIIGWLVWSRGQDTLSGVNNNEYQAVFFTNGQVYFGKLQGLNSDYLKLTDIYYLQASSDSSSSSNPQETSTDQNNVQLIKLGNEVHGPEDAMVISRLRCSVPSWTEQTTY